MSVERAAGPLTSSRVRERLSRRALFAANDTALNGSSRAAGRRRYFSDYKQWLWPYRYLLVFVFFLALVVTLLDLLWPLALKIVIDQALSPRAVAHPEARDFSTLHRWAIVILVLLALKQLLDAIRSYRLTVLNAKLVFRLRRKLFDTLLKLSLGDIAEMKGGGIVSRLSGDVDNVSGLVQQTLINPAVAVIRLSLTIAILLFISWRLAIVALILLPPLAPLTYIWLRRVRPIYRSTQVDKAQVDGRVVETFGGIRVVRTFRRETREHLTYALGHHTIIRKLLHASRLELLLEAGWGILVPAANLLIVWYGGLLVLRGEGRVSDIVAFQIYAVLLIAPIFQIVLSFSQTQKALASMERVFDALRLPADKPDSPGAVDAPSQVREIRIEQAHFAYLPNVPVLRDISLNVTGGETVALVGPSGAGKSTLTDLIARFHDPDKGRILLNGTDLRRMKLASFRRLLAIVPQDVFLFDGSIAENIAYGQRGATHASIIDAARRANAHEFITQLSQGYDTPIGERGFKLSGGQKQRLSIARAILADPQILILDEATSNLDTESEQLIQASLLELFRHRTTFVIAHRLSTIAHADQIIVMSQGQIVESGTHDTLLAARGMYYEMVERQRQSFAGADVVLE